MKMLKRSIYTFLPSLAFLTFSGGKGGGGNTISTQKLDPEVLQKMLLPMYSATERAAGVTPITDEDGNVTYQFNDYEGYDGQRLTDWNQYHMDANAMLPGAASAGDNQFATAMNNMSNLGGYQAPTVSANQIGAQQISSNDIANQNINAASLGRGSIRDVNSAGVTGAAVAADAFGSLAPQARASIRDVAGQGFMGGGLYQYMNPYRSQVIDTTMDALDRQRQIQQQQNAASAVQAGAFGGSRQGVVESETNRAFADQAAQTMAALNAQGFDTAASLQQADADRALQAQLANQGMDQSTTQQALNLSGQFGLANQDAALNAALANQGVDLNVGQLNTQNAQQAAVQNAANNLTAQQNNQASALQAALANQSTDLAAQQSNQSSSLEAALANQRASMGSAEFQMNAANQLAALADQATNRELGDMDTYLNAADMVQGMDQSKLDLAYQNWMDEQNHELNQANILQGAASGYPAGNVTTQSGGGKIICTMMNESYGFGHFRNQIWLEQSANLDPAIERGYHRIFLPVIAFAKGDGWMRRMARKIMEHGARHRTADIWKQKHGKRDRVGQAYRLVFEPICYVVGKLIKER